MRTSTRATVVAGTTALGTALALATATAPAGAVTTTHEAMVFSSDRAGDSEIYRQDADGSLHRLTRNKVADHSPAFSPDGTRIAYVSERGGDDEIVVMRADGTHKRQLTHNTRDGRSSANDGAPAWSPDGRWIAFASTRDGGEAEIYVMSADGRVERRVTVTEPHVTDSEPTWLPDSRTLVFASDRDGFEDVELFRIGMDGTGLARLTSTGAGSDENAPDVSPDGRLLAFSSNRSGTHDLYVMAVDGSGVRRLGGSAQLDDVRPRWTADGQRVVFSTFASEEAQVGDDVWSIDADGTDAKRLTTSPANDYAGDPSPRG